MRTPLRILPLAALLVVTAFAAGCGDGADPPPPTTAPTTTGGGPNLQKQVSVEAWTGGLCAAVTDWLADIGEANALSDIRAAQTNQQVKNGLVSVYTEMTKRASQFKKDIDGLGYPAIEDGQKVEIALSNATAKVVTLLDAGLKDVEALDTTDSAKMDASRGALATSLQAAASELADAFNDVDQQYDTRQISVAATNIAACKGLFT